jgi:hypothetical protein
LGNDAEQNGRQAAKKYKRRQMLYGSPSPERLPTDN